VGIPTEKCTFGDDLWRDQTRQRMITVNIKLTRLEYVRYLETHVCMALVFITYLHKKIKTGHRGCQLNNTDKCPRSRNYLKFTHGSLRLNTATLSLLTTRADNRFQTLMLRQTKALFYRTLNIRYDTIRDATLTCAQRLT